MESHGQRNISVTSYRRRIWLSREILGALGDIAFNRPDSTPLISAISKGKSPVSSVFERMKATIAVDNTMRNVSKNYIH